MTSQGNSNISSRKRKISKLTSIENDESELVDCNNRKNSKNSGNESAKKSPETQKQTTRDITTNETIEETELISDKLKLQNKLREYGLKPKYWSDVFERKLSITNYIQLKYLNDSHLNELQASIRTDIERETLKQIINENRNNKSGNDDRKRTLKEVSDDSQPNFCDFDNVKRQMHISLKSDGEPEKPWKPSKNDCDLDKILNNLPSTSGSRSLKITQLTDKEVINHASGSCALRGILLNQAIDAITETKQIVIDLVGDVTFQGPSMKQEFQFVEFKSRERSNIFQRSLQTIGKHEKMSTNIEIPIFGMKLQGSSTSMKDLDDTTNTSSEEVFESREKYLFVPVKSFEVKIENIRLTASAIKSLQTIESSIQSDDTCATSLSKCRSFFQTFGSHINVGILHFGGIFNWKAIYCSKTKSSNISISELVHDSLEGFVGMGYAEWHSAVGIVVSGNRLKSISSIAKKHSEEESLKVQLYIDQIGGPNDESDYVEWRKRLSAENETWSLISRGNFNSIWKVLENHTNDFSDTLRLIDFLQCAWDMLTFESSLDKFHITDYGLLLPKLRQTVDKLIDLTGDDDYLRSIVVSDVTVETFFSTIAFSPEIEDQMQAAKMHKEIALLVVRLKDIFLKKNQKLMDWINEINTNCKDSQSALSTENIDNIDMFISVLNCKFLPQINDMAAKKRLKHQQTPERYITKEMTTVCRRILKDFKTRNVRDYIILLSILSPLRFNEKIGFPRLLTLSNVKSFIEESEQIIREFNNSSKRNTKVQNQASLVEFIVKNITRLKYKSIYIEQTFNICVKEMTTRLKLNKELKSIIAANTTNSPYNWLQLQSDLLPFIHGKKKHRTTYSLPKLNIKKKNISKNAKYLKTAQEFKIYLDDIRMPSEINLFNSVTIHTKKTYTKKENLLWFLLNKIMTQHSSIYKMIEEHVKADDVNCEYDCKAVDDFEMINADEEDDIFYKRNENEHSFVNKNPMDLIVALFLCSSETLKQALASKMYACRLAVPLVLPDKSLAAASVSFLKSLLISTEGNRQMSAAECPCNILSFIRIGRPKVSKSEIINDLISHEKNHVFFNRHSPFGDSKRTISDGMVEAAFFNPILKSEKGIHSQKTTMILNLRGDGGNFKQQLKLISDVSSGIVVFITIELLESGNIQDLLEILNSPNSTVALMLDAEMRSIGDIKQIINTFKANSKDTNNTKLKLISNDGKRKSQSDVKRDINSLFKDLFSKTPTLSLLDILRVSNIVPDYEFGKKGQTVTKNIKEKLDSFTTTINIKREILPIQRDTFTSLSKCIKKLYKPSAYKTPENKAEIRQQISNLRMEQVKMLPHLHPLMCLILETVIGYNNSDSEELINFAMWLKLYLEKLTRETISASHAKSEITQKKLNAAIHCRQDEVEGLQTEVDNCILDTLESQLGIEHFIRELGQIYEAVTDQKLRVAQETEELVKNFPCVPAKLLLAGVPFEVMNGELIHVPIVWVEAVLNEVAKLIGDQKCLVISVVGIQSSGKSTLLNAMFGLQFPVGHGRTTKGAFMQMIPVDDEELAFKFIIVIDTEGLRAPELGHENYQHDNEFATFIMAIADINIVNIHGEAQTEMNEVLQMVVHALLKLKKTNGMKQLCVFAHQNVNAIDSVLSYTLQQLINKLDVMTAEAAEQLDICDIYFFKDVIDFDVNHVWYIPNLNNQDYSSRIEQMKESILYNIATNPKMHFTLKDITTRVKNIWEGILTEDFAFNFKNNLEAKAFTKLDRHYQKLYWELEKSMYTFARETRCSLFKCKGDSEFRDILRTARNELPVVLHKEFKRIENDFDTFIDKHNWKNMMLRWKQSYTLKLRTSLQSLSDRTDKEIRLIEDEILVSNKYEKAMKNWQDEINISTSKLAEEFKHTIDHKLPEELLLDRFYVGWTSLTTNLSTTLAYTPDEPDDILYKTIAGLKTYESGYYNQELDTLTINYCQQIKYLQGRVTFEDIQLGTHIVIEKNYVSDVEISEVYINQTIDFTDKLFVKIENYMSKLHYQDIRFNEVYISEIGEIVETTIDRHNQHKDNYQNFRLKPQYKAMVMTKIAAYCVKEFININEKYDQKHNQRKKIDEYKETALELFLGLVNKKTEEVIAGNFFQEAIKKSIIEQVEELLLTKIEAEILKSFEYSKYDVMKSVMKDLIDENSFDRFSVYITSPDSYVEMWLIGYINKYLFRKDGVKLTNYGLLSKPIVENEIEDVIDAVNNATDKIKSNYGDLMPRWIEEFISSSIALPISKETLSHVGKRRVNDIQNFRKTVLRQIEITKKSLIETVINTNIETVRWKKDPYTSIFKRLWGCCATCPFCSEPCEHNADHLRSVKHSCRQHRPQGVGEYAWDSGKGELVTDICNYLIYESSKDFILPDSCKKYRYEHYRTKFPEWEISQTYNPSKYWMWYFKTFKDDISEKNKTKVPKLPDDWYSVSADDAKNSL